MRLLSTRSRTIEIVASPLHHVWNVVCPLGSLCWLLDARFSYESKVLFGRRQAIDGRACEEQPNRSSKQAIQTGAGQGSLHGPSNLVSIVCLEKSFPQPTDAMHRCYSLIAICTTLPTSGLGAFANIIITGRQHVGRLRAKDQG